MQREQQRGVKGQQHLYAAQTAAAAAKAAAVAASANEAAATHLQQQRLWHNPKP